MQEFVTEVEAGLTYTFPRVSFGDGVRQRLRNPCEDWHNGSVWLILYLWVLVRVLPAPLLIQLPACGLEKAEKDDPKPWNPAAAWETQSGLLA